MIIGKNHIFFSCQLSVISYQLSVNKENLVFRLLKRLYTVHRYNLRFFGNKNPFEAAICSKKA
ncbi:MAG: hypothetical protein DRR00_17050 [Candidatus Parabeggiatoa sp. nov. 3]|nr:MAG: hypothetical protein DRR00_17050 [Gammaproteobacteria bacterium]